VVSRATLIYVGEIERQCQYALSAFAQLLDVLAWIQQPQGSRTERPPEFDFYNEVFRSIHSFLTHASNVSRILWPALPRRKKRESDEAYIVRIRRFDRISRSIDLRAQLDLADEHLLKDRTLRDHLEHFDERLDQWRKVNETKRFADIIVGPPDMISGQDRSEILRWLNPATMNFYFRGDVFDLQAIAMGIRQIKETAERLNTELFPG
jgi:hypothetical protein